MADVVNWKSKMKNESHAKVVLPEILAITSGLFMSIGGILSLLMNGWHQLMPGGQFMKDAMMISWWQLIMPQPYIHIMWTMASLSLIVGLIVIVYSYKIHKEPEKIREWGFVILIASIVGLFCSNGFGVGGAILGIITGVISSRIKMS